MSLNYLQAHSRILLTTKLVSHQTLYRQSPQSQARSHLAGDGKPSSLDFSRAGILRSGGHRRSGACGNASKIDTLCRPDPAKHETRYPCEASSLEADFPLDPTFHQTISKNSHTFKGRITNHVCGAPGDARVPAEQSARESRGTAGTAVGIAAAAFVLLSPSLPLPPFHGSDGVAMAGTLEKLRSAEKAVESILPSVTSGKLLEKIVLIISGQTVVTPDVLEKEVKAVLEGDQNQGGSMGQSIVEQVVSSTQDTWASAIDLVTSFKPAVEGESAWVTITGLVEAMVERVAAFELSMITGLGTRWLLLAPLLAVPMWQMRQSGVLQSELESAEAQRADRDTNLRSVRVRRELERLQIKAALLEAVQEIGPEAIIPRSPRSATAVRERSILDLVSRLQALNPDRLTSLDADLGDPTAATAGDEQEAELEGSWQLLYVSEGEVPAPQQQQQAALLRIPGVHLADLRQSVGHSQDRRSEGGAASAAENTAQISLGPLGVVQVAMQGTWQHESGVGGSGLQRSTVSFDSVSAKPLVILGSPVDPSAPSLRIPMPPAFRQLADWEVLYLDNEIRINEGPMGRLFLFRRLL